MLHIYIYCFTGVLYKIIIYATQLGVLAINLLSSRLNKQHKAV